MSPVGWFSITTLPPRWEFFSQTFRKSRWQKSHGRSDTTRETYIFFSMSERHSSGNCNNCEMANQSEFREATWICLDLFPRFRNIDAWNAGSPVQAINLPRMARLQYDFKSWNKIATSFGGNECCTQHLAGTVEELILIHSHWMIWRFCPLLAIRLKIDDPFPSSEVWKAQMPFLAVLLCMCLYVNPARKNALLPTKSIWLHVQDEKNRGVARACSQSNSAPGWPEGLHENPQEIGWKSADY